MGIKSIEGTGLIGKRVTIGPSFVSATKDVVGGRNDCSGKFMIMMK